MKLSRLLELIFHFTNGLKCEKCGKWLSFEDWGRSIQKIENPADIASTLTCECGGKYKELVRIKQDEKQKPILIVDNHEINTRDFQRLRKIVLYQNLPDYKDDSWVDRAVREDQAARAELQNRDSRTASVEKKIVCVAAKSNYKINEIYDLSIRKFIMLLSTIDDAINYEATRVGMMTGLCSMKDPPEHWIYKKEKGLYDAAVDADAMKRKVNSAQ